MNPLDRGPFLTPDEARMKACCGDIAMHRSGSSSQTCCGTNCMAWRWGPQDLESYTLPGEPPEGQGWGRYWEGDPAAFVWKRYTSQRGYCGLAGAS